MPGEPEVLGGASAPQPLQVFSVKDDRALYQIVRVTVRDSSLSLAGAQARQDYYDGAAKMLLLAQQNSRLVRRTSFSTPAGEGMELEFTAIHQGTGQLVTKYNRSLLIGRVGYGFNFIPHQRGASPDQQTEERRRKFFASIVCK